MRRMMICRSIWAMGAIWLLAGCAERQPPTTAGEPIVLPSGTTPAAVDAAEDVLVRMDFDIEKADAVNGVVRTRPLRSAQVFEFWRQDNLQLRDAAEANLQTLRKWVEITLRRSDGSLAIDCRVRVQRLSLPGSRTASVSQAYQMHSRSTPTLQSLRLNPGQKREMVWIDQDDDALLSKRIVEQIADRMGINI
jgi:hypothetical protein